MQRKPLQNVRIPRISSRTIRLTLNRETCPSLHLVHMGPQVLRFVLAGHESVRPRFSNRPLEYPLISSRQPILADEVQTFKALICVHKVLQEGHPVTLREAQSHLSWLESIARATVGDGLKGGFLRMRYFRFGIDGDARLWFADTRIRPLSSHQVALPSPAHRVQWHIRV